MAYRDSYDNDYEARRRSRRDTPEDEGFFDRVRGWFHEWVGDRPHSPGNNRDYNRYQSRNFDRSGRVGVYDQGNDYDYRRNMQRRSYRPGYNQDADYNRDNDRGSWSASGDRYSGERYDSEHDNNRQRGPEWERTRQWRSNYDQGPQYRRGNEENRYHQRYDTGWETDEDYEYGLGRTPEDDWDYRSSYNPSQRSGGEYYGYPGRQTGYSRDYGPGYGRYTRRGYNRDFYRGDYPAAGMGSDYNGRPGDWGRNDYDESVNYSQGDVGYEDEGAFYQDLDEPINYETQDYEDASGHEPVFGPFYGIGPQGYQRSDERILEDVCERLTRNGRVDASDIDIQVNNGEVTLQGSVPERSMKRIAEDIADDVGGVRDIHNEIKVNRQRGWRNEWANESMAGQTHAGAGLTTEGDIDTEGANPVAQANANQRGVREGMEVIGADARVVGRVKEIRQSDFLVDRELSRDVYVPFSAVDNVGEQVLLNVITDQVDQQGWQKPSVI